MGRLELVTQAVKTTEAFGKNSRHRPRVRKLFFDFSDELDLAVAYFAPNASPAGAITRSMPAIRRM
jgi:hypothetical protein